MSHQSRFPASLAQHLQTGDELLAIDDSIAEELGVTTRGVAVLQFRRTSAGSGWHRDAGLTTPEPVESLKPLSMFTVQQYGRDEPPGLSAWMRRPGAPVLRGVVSRQTYGSRSHLDHWELAGESPTKYTRRRPIGLDSVSSHAPSGEPLGAFSMSIDESRGWLVVDFEAEPGGLILARLGIARDIGIDSIRDMFAEHAWSLAAVAANGYWSRWERLHQRRILDAIPQVIDPRSIASTSPVDLFRHVMNYLDPILLEMASALQAPAIGLFLSNQSKNEIELVSHVGYESPGTRRTYEYRTGLTRMFSWEVLPEVHDLEPRAFQIATEEGIERAYRAFGIEKVYQEAGVSGASYVSDQWVRKELRDIVERGPWAWGHVTLDANLWHVPSLRDIRAVSSSTLKTYGLRPPDAMPMASGVIKVHGRIPSDLDREGAAAPFAARELIALHQWARLIAAELQRVATVYADHIARRLVHGAAAELSASPAEMVSFLRASLAAKAVMLLGDNEGERFRVVALDWAPSVDERTRRYVLNTATSALAGTPGRAAITAAVLGDDVETLLPLADGSKDVWNSHFKRILFNRGAQGLVVLIGVPSNLDQTFLEDSCRRPFPPILRAPVHVMADMLAGRAELSRRTATSPNLELRNAWRRLTQSLTAQSYEDCAKPVRNRIDELAADLAATFTQAELAAILEVETQTVRRHILRLTGKEKSGHLDWRGTGATGHLSKLDELTRRVVDLVDDLGKHS